MKKSQQIILKRTVTLTTHDRQLIKTFLINMNYSLSDLVG